MVKRNTIQKKLILKAVNKLKCHATADEIYNEVSKNYPNISKATVYRNLIQLSENGEIKKMDIAIGSERYDHICANHYHIQCKKCKKIFDVDMDYIEDISKNIKNTHGFNFENHDILFYGTCPECLKNSSEKE